MPFKPVETTRRPRFSQTATTFAATSLPASTTAGLAWGKQAVEQLQFRGEILFQRCVIVEVVAREIGKGSGTEADAVEPALRNAVRGGLQGEMGNSAAR